MPVAGDKRINNDVWKFRDDLFVSTGNTPVPAGGEITELFGAIENPAAYAVRGDRVIG